MRIACTQENLIQGLNSVSHIAAKNASLPILGNVLLRASGGVFTLAATNLEVAVRTVVRAKVEVDGSVSVPATVLHTYIGLLPKDKVSLSMEDDRLLIQGQGARTKMNTLPAADFPLLPTVEAKERVRLPVAALREALTQVTFATASDETRPELSGVLFKLINSKLFLVGTDSYRLAEKVLDLGNANAADRQVIIPAKTMQELLRLLGTDGEGVVAHLGEGQVLFTAGEVELISRLIEGQYPDYAQIIPSGSTTSFTAPVRDLANAVRQASLFCRQGINDVRLTLVAERGELVITATNAAVGENTTTLPVKAEGVDSEIVFNYRYLLEGLNALSSETAKLSFTTSTAPALLTPLADDSYRYLIMPIRQ